MEIQQLRYFISAAKNLNFTEAAKEHFVAQSAISQQIKELEKCLGVTLFIRTNRSVRLTAAGITLLNEAKDIINKTDEAVKKVQLAARGVIGTLKIGFILPMEKVILPNILKDFTCSYPHVDLSLIRLDWGYLNKSLEKDEIDLAFTFDLGFENMSEIKKLKICSVDIAVAVSNDHRLSSRDSIKLSELVDEPMIIFPRNVNTIWYDRIIQMCTQNGFYPNIVREHPRTETRLMMVEAGIGVAIVTNLIETCSSHNLRFINIDDKDTFMNLIVAWKKTNFNPAISHFLRQIENYHIKHAESQDIICSR